MGRDDLIVCKTCNGALKPSEFDVEGGVILETCKLCKLLENDEHIAKDVAVFDWSSDSTYH